MNQRIQELLIEAHKQTDGGIYNGHLSVWTEKFAELIVKECVSTLEFHGFEDAVPYIKWMATNKLGVEQ